MGNTYTALYTHFIFSTKNRIPFLKENIQPRIWEYMGGIAVNNRIKPITIGGVTDHMHLLLRIPASLSVSKVMQLIKGGSSKWIHDSFPLLEHFKWQDGYSAFSVSKSQLDTVSEYIGNQKTHHTKKTYKDEVLSFLEKYGVGYDEKYLWD